MTIIPAAGKNVPVLDNVLSLYVDPVTRLMMVKDWAGNEQPLSDFINASSSGANASYWPFILQTTTIDGTGITSIAFLTLDSSFANYDKIESLNFPDLTIITASDAFPSGSGADVIDVQNMTGLVSFLMPVLETVNGDIQFIGCDALTALNFSSVINFTDNFKVNNCPVITDLSLPVSPTIKSILISSNALLQTIDALPTLLNVTGAVDINSNNALESVIFENLVTCNNVSISYCPALTTINLQSLENGGENVEFLDNTNLTILLLNLSQQNVNALISINNNTSLLQLSLSDWNGYAGNAILIQNNTVLDTITWPAQIFAPSCTFSGNSLNVNSVNACLAAIVAGNVQNGSLNLSGGTNAAPSGQGTTDVATLISRGWSVTTN